MFSLKSFARSFTTVVCIAATALCCYGAGMHVRLVPVLTGSMAPHFAPGSLVVTEQVASFDLRKGDVIAFMPPAPYNVNQSAPVMHRIVEVQRDADGRIWVMTKGDSNPAADPWTLDLTDQLMAKAQVRVPVVGHVFAALKSADPKTALMSGAGLALFFGSLLALRARRHAGHCLHCRETESEAADRFQHDLRTPLTQMRASLELLGDATQLDDVQLRMVDIAERGTVRMIAQVEEIIAATDSGRVLGRVSN